MIPMVHYLSMETTKTTPSKMLTWTLAVALVIVINLFFYYVIATVYPERKFETFCPVQSAVYNDAPSCVNGGGQWTNNQLSPKQVTDAVKGGGPLGWCDPNFTCNQQYTHAQSIYNRNVFIVLIILSLAVLVIGITIPLEVLSLGLSWAGIVSLIIASLRYWSDAANWMRVIILALALVLLIWLAYKKFDRTHK
jgi:hypothetical protein